MTLSKSKRNGKYAGKIEKGEGEVEVEEEDGVDDDDDEAKTPLER